MKWLMLAVCVVVALAAFGGAMAALGMFVPKGHVASRKARFRASRDDVWKAITDIDAFPAWRTDLKKVERLPDRDGRPAWREHGRQGAVTFERVEAVPGERLVGRIADPDLPYGGSWTYELAPADGGVELRITERGEIYNPVFRFMSQFFDMNATLEEYLKALGKKFGEEVSPVADR